MIEKGEYRVEFLKEKMKGLIKSKKHASVNYIEFVDPETLEKVGEVDKPTRILMAVKVGEARLIDNMEVKP